MSEPVTQAQDHDRRLGRGRLEGIAEQTAQAIIDLRQDMRELRASIRWIIGMQVASLLALGSLLVSILLKLP